MKTAPHVRHEGEQPRVLRVQRGFRWGIAAVVLVNCWFSRFIANADIISYLDVGDQYWRGHWHDALNSYWSPLYSWVLGGMLRVARPSMAWEYPAVHLLNFAIAMGALFSFEFFWRELLALREEGIGSAETAPYAWAVGYLLFAYVHIVVHPMELATPDLMVAGLVYLDSGMILRFGSGRMRAGRAFLFGILLGVGYLAKTAMFPFAVVVLATVCVMALRRGEGKRLVAVAALGFALISAPYAAAISWNHQRFTLGDSAKLNMAWIVNGGDPTEGDAQSGNGPIDRLHRTPQLFHKPDVYAFGTAVAGTYPPWYDPTYWDAGLDTSFHPRREMVIMAENTVHLLGHLVLETGFLTGVMLFLFFTSDGMGEALRRLWGYWPILVPSMAVVLMYTMVVVEPRYYSGEMVVIFGAAVGATCIANAMSRRNVLRGATIALSVLLAPSVLWTMQFVRRENKVWAVQVTLAEQLRGMGAKPGDRTALMGDWFDEAAWARLAKVKIVADVPGKRIPGNSEAAFWGSGAEQQKTVLDLLKSTGANFVVADAPPATLPTGWVLLSGTGHAVYRFGP